MKTQLTPIEIESLRIAIAEECGWREISWVNLINPREAREHRQYCRNNEDRLCGWLPPYTTSLDAIQAAAMERFKTEDDQVKFQIELQHSDLPSGVCFVWQLTALDWCIAFARTAKIWNYKQS